MASARATDPPAVAVVPPVRSPGSGKPSSGKLPQTGDTNTFAAAALMGLSALAAAIHAGSRNGALDSQDTEQL
ncbi:MAG: LPXTG cell wall anchor domain-containing protein [Collinsella sp.]